MSISPKRSVFFFMTVIFLALSSTGPAQQQPVSMHPSVGDTFIVPDADYDHPVYKTSFESEAVLEDWQLEGGWMIHVWNGSLILDSRPSDSEEHGSRDHLVCWLKKEVPANFLLEFKIRPVNKRRGLNIVFFNARGRDGETVFDPSLEKRTGIFKQYMRGDLDNYHVSYFSPDRGFTNMRKNYGFHLVASGKDYFLDADPNTFQTVQIYKRDHMIRVLVDGKVAVAYDDDGITYGPVITHSGWIALRQMGFTQRCEYRELAVYPLKD
jgi:hypothetical protein